MTTFPKICLAHETVKSLGDALDAAERDFALRNPRSPEGYALLSRPFSDVYDRYRAALFARVVADHDPPRYKLGGKSSLAEYNRARAALAHSERIAEFLTIEMGQAASWRIFADTEAALKSTNAVAVNIRKQLYKYENAKARSVDASTRHAERLAGIVRHFPRHRPFVRSVPHE